MAVKYKEDGKTVDSYYMVFPYCDHDLTGLLESPDIHMTVPVVKCYAQQLFSGLKYLHSKRILHRDMKGANLLVNNRGMLMIADFGLARHCDPRRTRFTGGVVTRWYRPPELLLGSTHYGPGVDVWGAGCVLAEMFLKRPLFPGESDLHQLELISKVCGEINESSLGERTARHCPGLKTVRLTPPLKPVKGFSALISHELQGHALLVDLLTKILKINPDERLSAEQVLNHRYFTAEPAALLPEQYRQKTIFNQPCFAI